MSSFPSNHSFSNNFEYFRKIVSTKQNHDKRDDLDCDTVNFSSSMAMSLGVPLMVFMVPQHIRILVTSIVVTNF